MAVTPKMLGTATLAGNVSTSPLLMGRFNAYIDRNVPAHASHWEVSIPDVIRLPNYIVVFGGVEVAARNIQIVVFKINSDGTTTYMYSRVLDLYYHRDRPSFVQGVDNTLVQTFIDVNANYGVCTRIITVTDTSLTFGTSTVIVATTNDDRHFYSTMKVAPNKILIMLSTSCTPGTGYTIGAYYATITATAISLIKYTSNFVSVRNTGEQYYSYNSRYHHTEAYIGNNKVLMMCAEFYSSGSADYTSVLAREITLTDTDFSITNSHTFNNFDTDPEHWGYYPWYYRAVIPDIIYTPTPGYPNTQSKGISAGLYAPVNSSVFGSSLAIFGDTTMAKTYSYELSSIFTIYTRLSPTLTSMTNAGGTAVLPGCDGSVPSVAINMSIISLSVLNDELYIFRAGAGRLTKANTSDPSGNAEVEQNIIAQGPHQAILGVLDGYTVIANTDIEDWSYVSVVKSSIVGNKLLATANGTDTIQICAGVTNKLVEVTSICLDDGNPHKLLNENKVQLLFNGVPLYTESFLGSKMISFSHCPIVLTASDTLSVKVIQGTSGITATVFGIEEDV